MTLRADGRDEARAYVCARGRRLFLRLTSVISGVFEQTPEKDLPSCPTLSALQYVPVAQRRDDEQGWPRPGHWVFWVLLVLKAHGNGTGLGVGLGACALADATSTAARPSVRMIMADLAVTFFFQACDRKWHRHEGSDGKNKCTESAAAVAGRSSVRELWPSALSWRTPRGFPFPLSPPRQR